MIPVETPPVSPSPTGTPIPVATPTPSPAPGLDPGYNQFLIDKYGPTGKPGGAAGSDQIWYSQAGSDLVVKTNGSLHPNGTEPLMKIADVMYQFWQWDQAQVDKLAEKLVKANMLPSINVTRDDVWSAFRNVLMDAAQQYAANKTKAPNVEQVLQGYMKRPVGDSTGGETKPAKYETTNIQTNLSDPTEADAVLQDTLQQRLGRAPTDAEKQSFLAALNAKQRANPSVTSTQYTLDAKTGGYNTTVGETSGGVNAGQYADDFATNNNKKEYGAYQAATTYFDAMMSALGTPGGI